LGRTWTPQEIELLKELYPIKKANELAQLLNRSVNAIQLKAERLGIPKKHHFSYGKQVRFWAEEDFKKLKKWYGKIPVSEIAKRLNRSKKTILFYAKKLGLKHSRFWTEEEVELLRQLYPTTPISELKKILKKTEASIYVKASKLGLKKRVLSFINGRPAPNNEGEEIGEKIFSLLGWSIKKRGTTHTPYDYIVEKNGEVLTVNVKKGQDLIIRNTNLRRLIQFENPSFLFISEDGGVYLLRVESQTALGEIQEASGRPVIEPKT
jgi:hypothetical protein